MKGIKRGKLFRHLRCNTACESDARYEIKNSISFIEDAYEENVDILIKEFNEYMEKVYAKIYARTKELLKK